MIAPEPPAGSAHYQEGWRHGYEQAEIDRERSDTYDRFMAAAAEQRAQRIARYQETACTKREGMTMDTKTNPLPTQIMMNIPAVAYEDIDYVHDDDYVDVREVTSDPEVATVVTSLVNDKVGKGIHKLVLDIDMDVKVFPSSTPGHHHLFIDHELSTEDFNKVLTVLSEVGIIEPGYCNASLDRGFTAIRLPWIKKKAAAAKDTLAQILFG